MFCPGCKKEHLISLSVCPACGVMAGDSVWQEMESKIKIVKIPKVISNRRNKSAVQKPSSQIKLKPPPGPVLGEIKTATAEISTKKTNRTLVEFQSKDGTVPEWRTQLRNAVRQRKMQRSINTEPPAASQPTVPPPAGDDEFFDSNEIIEVGRPVVPENGFLANALKRIDASRDKFLIEVETDDPDAREISADKKKITKAKQHKADPKSEKSSVNFPPKQPYSPNVDLYDTSELNPDLKPAKVSSSFGRAAGTAPAKVESEQVDEPVEEVSGTEIAEDLESTVAYEDDRAPIAYRFNAGLFDLLTASFASLILLAPFMLLGGSWFTVSGLFAFLATSTLVTFIYLTTTIGLFGKSFGMHLFSIEMIDGQGEEYPSLHQAAVSSSVFLLSLAFGGAGFLTCLIDEEKRPIHDIVSNTLVVKEL